MTFDPRAALLAAERALSEVRADPIKAFRFSSTQSRDFVEAFHEYDEVALQAGNQSGKTTLAAHFFVAMMRGITSLCGDIVGVEGVIERHPPVSLPLVGTPASFLVLAQGREMSKESVVKCVLEAVGEHPHHVERNSNNVAAVWVKPDKSRSDDWHDWSRMRFFVEDGQSVAGMRLDGVWADEPPKWDLWVELRMRGKSNRLFLRGITFTPIDKRRWKPIREDFKGCERGLDGKKVIRMRVYDNKRLSAEHLAAVERAAKGPLSEAKLNGDYVDVTGSCPFDIAGLKKWRARCMDPLRTDEFTLFSGARVKYQVWKEPEADEPYMVVADPSSGVEDEDGDRDPGGLVVVGRRNRQVVARYNGYIIAGELGRLSVHLAKRYNRALLVWERNSGYGEAFYQGIGDYGNVYMEHHLDTRGITLSERLGWYTTATTRGTLIGALQKALTIDGSLYLWSEDAVESLENVVVKRDGIRIEAGSGSHDEDMIILGIACHLLETCKASPAAKKSGSDTFLGLMGLKRRRVEQPDPFSLP